MIKFTRITGDMKLLFETAEYEVDQYDTNEGYGDFGINEFERDGEIVNAVWVEINLREKTFKKVSLVDEFGGDVETTPEELKQVKAELIENGIFNYEIRKMKDTYTLDGKEVYELVY